MKPLLFLEDFKRTQKQYDKIKRLFRKFSDVLNQYVVDMYQY